VLSQNARIGVDHARRAREDLGLAMDLPVPDVLEAVEAIGAPVAVLTLADGVAGAWVAGSIFVNGTQWLVRQRFTLAHELGHVRMGHGPVVDHPAAFSGGESAPDEVQANVFAAEFLVPLAAVKARVQAPVSLEEVVLLACEFGVSAQMVRIRLQTAGVLRDDALTRKLDAEIHEGLHRRLEELLGCEPPSDSLSELRLPRLPSRPSALAAHLAGDISLGRLAEAAGRSVDEMRATLDRWGLRRS
jgi:Zn-dependent peptidase ImmA (M78 family)